jgi:hypothetical protein
VDEKILQIGASRESSFSRLSATAYVADGKMMLASAVITAAPAKTITSGASTGPG